MSSLESTFKPCKAFSFLHWKKRVGHCGHCWTQSGEHPEICNLFFYYYIHTPMPFGIGQWCPAKWDHFLHTCPTTALAVGKNSISTIQYKTFFLPNCSLRVASAASRWALCKCVTWRHSRDNCRTTNKYLHLHYTTLYYTVKGKIKKV